MFGIKMPWTRRKERLAKELADKLELEKKERLEREARLKEWPWVARQPLRTPPRPVSSFPTHTKTTHVSGYESSPQVSNTDTMLPMLTGVVLANSFTAPPAAVSYCAPNSGASSYTPSYESSSYSSDSSSSCSSSNFD